MSKPIVFTPELKANYDKLYKAMALRPNAPVVAIRSRVKALVDHRLKYWELSEETGVPWPLIACIHSMEAGGRWNAHLHNGDPLTHRTTHVPAGRPVAEPAAGKGKPYGWKESALDALKNHMDGTHTAITDIKEWSVARMLFVLESYNGYGYLLYKKINSPYLWSYTNQWTKGKYVGDHKYDPNAGSKQIGAAILLKQLLIEDKRLYDAAIAKRVAESEKESKS